VFQPVSADGRTLIHDVNDHGLLAALPAGPPAQFAAAVLRREGVDASVAASGPVVAAYLDAFAFVDARKPGEIAARLLDAEVPALDGGRPVGTVIQLACDDRDFIVTSLTEELHRAGVRPVRVLAASFGCTRSAETGRVEEIGPARGADHAEGFIELELDARLDGGRAASVLARVRSVLESVFRTTDDQDAMRDLVARAAARTRRTAGARFDAHEVRESTALTDWLLDGHAVLLGACRFPVQDGLIGDVDERTCLGLLRDPRSALRRPPSAMPDALISASRVAEISPVHRQVPMQRFDLVLVDDAGEIDGVGRLVCVFTRQAEAAPVRTIPLLRWKLEQLLERQDAVQGSYDEQAVASLFQALPKDELFCSNVDALDSVVRSLLAEDRHHRVRVLIREEPEAEAVALLVTMPSELYTRALRERIERFLRAQLEGDRVDVELSMGSSSATMARFLVHLRPGAPAPDGLDALAREVQLLCRTWEQELVLALGPVLGDRARRAGVGWAERLPDSYRDAVDAEAAVDDVLALERLHERGGPGLEAWFGDAGTDAAGGAPEGVVRLTIASAGPPVELSRLIPLLESLGLWVVDELSWDLGDLGLHRLAVRVLDNAALDLDEGGPRVAAALVALWEGRTDADPLNRLVTSAGMTWPDVAVLRAYRRYRRQVDYRYASAYVDDVIVEHPDVARTLVELFRARFGSGTGDPSAVLAELNAACDRVERLDHDRILRGLIGTLDATVRTNWDARGDGPLAFVLDSASVPDLPEPVPYREIFVHGPSVEGVHLRAGPVARGGLRYSDRPEDLRSEILDLMRTQVLKNALIVPTGAKGGFVLRGGEQGPDAVRAAYETFVGCLLDLTSDDDPYLVVAADKGTASFSDVANGIAVERGYWLGDAFASGGSVGYDHRELGITARGAWVAIGRHFRELDVDVTADSFTAVGIGDMSGDVFGNGVLLASGMRLLAAFDHRDVFLDPDPDPQASLAERRRLHELPTSSWQDYDRSVLSPGGGVHSRSLKRIDLNPQVQSALGIRAEALTPPELIQAILRASVDLLYLGGIGTYVRASSEPDASVDDRANAELRITADQLRARVVGEGANLGFTQRARIEYARRGGRINMDAIDNSAGVDTSDREVNIKVLLGVAMDGGEIDERERSELLAGATDEVVASVLADSADQCDALRRASEGSARELTVFEQTQQELVGAGIVDADVEALPAPDEYEARRRAGAGLTRPELAVLQAGAKRSVKAAVLASSLPDDASTRELLTRYFPASLTARFDHLVDRHRLRRELIASELSNELVDHLGPAFAARLAADTGRSLADVAAAFWVARSVAGGAALWEETTVTLAPAAPDVTAERADPGDVAAELLDALTRHELTRAGEPIGDRIASVRPVFDSLAEALPGLDRPEAARARRRLADQLHASGVRPEAAARLAVLPELVIVPDVATLAAAAGCPPLVAAGAFLEVSDRLGIERLLRRIRGAVRSASGAVAGDGDRWAAEARGGLLDDLVRLRCEGAAAVLESIRDPRPETPEDGRHLAQQWLVGRADELSEAVAVRRRVEDDPHAGIDAVVVAVRALRRVVTVS
jgi:glutamate dehydrogenase